MAGAQVIAVLVAAVAMGSLPPTAPERVLVVVASNQGDAHEPRLMWAEQDARRFSELMVDIGSVDPENVFAVIGSGVLRVDEVLERVRSRVDQINASGRDTELVAYVASHADPEKLHLSGEHMPLEDLRSWFETVPSRTRIMFIDTCFSGALWRERSFADSNRVISRNPGPKGTIYISASAASEVAQESDDIGGSYFASHLMTGLRGAADADGDGQITSTEVYQYTYLRTYRDSFANAPVTQHPQLRTDVDGERPIVLARVDEANARLLLHKDAVGQYLVLNDRTSTVLLDLEIEPGPRGLTFAIPAGRYKVFYRGPLGLMAGEFVAGEGQTVPLPELTATERTMSGVAQRGRKFDPDPVDLRVGATSFWRWTSRIDSDAGMLGGGAWLEVLLYREIALWAGIDYAQSLSGSDSGVTKLGLLRGTLGVGYARELEAWLFEIGALVGLGWGRQESREPAALRLQTSDSEIFSVAGLFGADYVVSRRFDIGLRVEPGALIYRLGGTIKADPYLQFALSFDLRL